MLDEKLLKKIRVEPASKVRLEDFDPGWAQSPTLEAIGKKKVKARAEEVLEQSIKDLETSQELLYADDRYALLIILQAMDAAGKDGTIKHVMSGLNPQGCQVHSFKKPSEEDLDHDFLWRCSKRLPERGCIGIFNRSYYEEVLVVKVHQEILESQRLPPGKHGKQFWNDRYDDINNFEKHLVNNGTIVLKFFLHISKDEQKRRFLQRLDRPEKNWKFSPADLAERGFWDNYQSAYEDALSATSTEWAPWYVVPADHKWVSRAVVADVVCRTIRGMDLKYPEVPPAKKELLEEARKKLEAE